MSSLFSFASLIKYKKPSDNQDKTQQQLSPFIAKTF